MPPSTASWPGIAWRRRRGEEGGGSQYCHPQPHRWLAGREPRPRDPPFGELAEDTRSAADRRVPIQGCSGFSFQLAGDRGAYSQEPIGTAHGYERL